MIALYVQIERLLVTQRFNGHDPIPIQVRARDLPPKQSQCVALSTNGRANRSGYDVTRHASITASRQSFGSFSLLRIQEAPADVLPKAAQRPFPSDGNYTMLKSLAPI